MRSSGTYRDRAVMQRRMAEQLVDRLAGGLSELKFDRVLEAGCGTGTLTEILLQRFQVKHLVANDIVGSFRGDILKLAGEHAGTQVDFLDGDIETVALPGNVDLVAANAVFQWLNDLDVFFERIADCMRPGAVIAFTTFGTRNLREVSAITGVSLGYRSYEQYRLLLERHFEIISGSEEEAALRLGSPLEVLRHMKATGANAIDRRHWKKGDLDGFSSEYVRRFGSDGAVSLTYNPLFFIAVKKDGG